jgi:aminopeptidase C
VFHHIDFKSALVNRKKTTADIHVYNTKLDFSGNKKVTNQKSSGRCWLFATENVWHLLHYVTTGCNHIEHASTGDSI